LGPCQGGVPCQGVEFLQLFVYTCTQHHYMKITILHLVDGARKAEGLTVVIDVFRAFSLAAYAFNAGVDRIFPVGKVEEAFALRELMPGALIAGERNEQKVEGFDFGNSPSELLNVDLKGKTLIHTTSAGTQGLVNAVNAEILLTGSFVNADAIVEFIQKIKPNTVSLVCMGYGALHPIEEDTFCAEYLRDKLLGKNPDFKAMKQIMRQTSGQRFFDPEKQHYSPQRDFELCLDLNCFNFIIVAERFNERLVLKAENK
jgi:2-phosphosulfolactate phosphatase